MEDSLAAASAELQKAVAQIRGIIAETSEGPARACMETAVRRLEQVEIETRLKLAAHVET